MPPTPPSPVENSGWRRRLETPSRDALLARYSQMESLSRVLLGIELLVGVAAWTWVALTRPNLSTPLPWIAGAIGGLGVFRHFLPHAFLNKKRLEQIRPDARFGIHTRDSVMANTRSVFQRLGLSPGSAPIFLIRDKDVNAHAVRCELLPGFRMFNGIYLNRSIVHLLDDAELSAVIGHELGHVFPYAPLLSRTYAIHAWVSASISFAAVAALPFVGMILCAPLLVLWILDQLIAMPHSRLSRAIEFLCDDYGVQASGLLPALSSELKIAVESETRRVLLLRALQSKASGASVDLPALVEAYDEAIPFGKADPAAFERDLDNAIRESRSKDRSLSSEGFMKYLRGNQTNEAADREWIDSQLALHNTLQAVGLVVPDRSRYLGGSHAWTLTDATHLIDAIESQPNAVLARLSDEMEDRYSSHPNPSRRLLFIWRHWHRDPEGL